MRLFLFSFALTFFLTANASQINLTGNSPEVKSCLSSLVDFKSETSAFGSVIIKTLGYSIDNSTLLANMSKLKNADALGKIYTSGQHIYAECRMLSSKSFSFSKNEIVLLQLVLKNCISESESYMNVLRMVETSVLTLGTDRARSAMMITQKLKNPVVYTNKILGPMSRRFKAKINAMNTSNETLPF